MRLARGQAWRARNPGYWREFPRFGIGKTGISMRSPQQDLLMAQPTVLIGLIARLVGTPQQDDVVRTTDRLLRLGQDILAMSVRRPSNVP